MLLVIDTDSTSNLPYYLIRNGQVSCWVSTIENAFNSTHSTYQSDPVAYINNNYPLANIYEFTDTYSYEEFKANNPHLFI